MRNLDARPAIRLDPPVSPLFQKLFNHNYITLKEWATENPKVPMLILGIGENSADAQADAVKTLNKVKGKGTAQERYAALQKKGKLAEKVMKPGKKYKRLYTSEEKQHGVDDEFSHLILGDA